MISFSQSYWVNLEELNKFYGNRDSNLFKYVEEWYKDNLWNESEIFINALENIRRWWKINKEEFKIYNSVLWYILYYWKIWEKLPINKEIYFWKNYKEIEDILKNIDYSKFFIPKNNFLKILELNNLKNILVELKKLETEENLNNFIKNIEFCIENNLDMIIFSYTWFSLKTGINNEEDNENLSSETILKLLAILISFFILANIYSNIIESGINSMLSKQAKFRMENNFVICKNWNYILIEPEDFKSQKDYKTFKKEKDDNFKKIYWCDKYEWFYDKNLTNLDEKLLSIKKWELKYEKNNSISYISIMSLLLSYFSIRLIDLFFVYKRRRLEN